MKKLFLVIALAVIGIAAKAQAISDMAVIPIGVTLNSIARITVTSGGNIEFVVNTMDQYDNGVKNTSATTTTFSVASSGKFGVTLQADNSNLIGTVDANHKMDVKLVEYQIEVPTGTDAATPNITETTQLTNTAEYILGDDQADHAAGNYSNVKIKWSLATKQTQGAANPLHLLPSDRYVVNAFLQLQQAN